jgi:hypothetical protein
MSARCLGARCHSQPPEGAPHEVVNLRGHRSRSLGLLPRVECMKQLRRVLSSAFCALLKFCLPFTVLAAIPRNCCI